MLHRQRGILKLLLAAGEEAPADAIVAQVINARGRIAGPGSPGYDFVQARDGPVSFTLTHELAALIEAGYIRQPAPARLALTPSGRAEAKRPEKPRRARTTPDDAPELFASPRRTKPAAPAAYTAGYEGLSLERFLTLLLDAGIERLIDVRRNPFSRRFGFHKSTLQHSCEHVGIDYVHLPALGIASELREGLDDGGPAARAKLFRDYRTRLLPAVPKEVDHACRLIRERPSVLVCLEARPEDCHRSSLAEEIARRTGLPVVHLHPGT